VTDVHDNQDPRLDDEDAFDRAARSVGDELRRRAPDDGIERLAARRKAQLRTRTALAGGVVAVLAIAGLAVRAAQAPRTNRPSPQIDRSTPATSTLDTTTTTPSTFPIHDTGAAQAPTTLSELGDNPTSQTLFPALVTSSALAEGPWTAQTLPVGTTPSPLDNAKTIASCASFVGDPNGPLGDSIDSDGIQFADNQSRQIGESMSLYPTVEAATKVLDALATRDWVACNLALEAMNSRPPAGDEARMVGYAIDRPPLHGDRQISFGAEYEYIPKSGAAYSHAYIETYIQLGRVVIDLYVSNDARPATDPEALVNTTAAAAVDAARSALAT
jgi:hypothetical protein